jgi:hypothetical protein
MSMFLLTWNFVGFAKAKSAHLVAGCEIVSYRVGEIMEGGSLSGGWWEGLN